MAIANFFDKAALAASQVLNNFDRRQFEETLSAHPVGLAADAAAVSSREGVLALDLSVRLLARLYPRLVLSPLAREAAGRMDELAAIARSINPEIEITDRLDDAIACVVVGDTRPMTARPLFIGSAGWTALFSPDDPVGSTDSPFPFGAGAAACFGAANVFRTVFSSELPKGDLDSAFSLSLLDYQKNGPRKHLAARSEIDLGETSLIGLGAIGNGAIWALANTDNLVGRLHLIDHEVVELSNLQRYVLMGQEHVEQSKVEAAAVWLDRPRLDVHPHPHRWADFLATRDDWDLHRVAVAVDTAADRVNIQAALPRRTFNAWTQAEDLGVSRHTDFLDAPCLACLYLPDGEAPSQSRLIADAVGLPEAEGEFRALLYLRTPVDRALLERIAKAKGVPLEPLLDYEGRPLQDFYSRAVCGGVLLHLGATAGAASVDAPLAFQSALAGILLAAEVVIDAANLRPTPTPTTTRIDLLRPLTPVLSFPEKKHRSGLCICQDGDYRSAYAAKYTSLRVVGAHPPATHA